MNFLIKTKNERGAIMIIALIFVLVVSTMVVSLVVYSAIQLRAHRQAVGRVQGLNIAEAGIEAAVWKLNNQIGYNGETNTPYADGVYNITVTNLSGSSKLVRAESFVPNAANPVAHRVVQVTVAIGTTNVGFNYGVQVGEGGVYMDNSATIIGNVYSDGDIVGTNTARIQGTAIAAGASGAIDGMDIDNNAWSYILRNNSRVSGNATHSIVQNSTVTGNVIADSISGCNIGGNATYDTRSGCTVGGTATTPNPNNFTPAEKIPLPITDEQITTWQQEAEAGGVIGTQNYLSGTRNLGPIKINGDLYMSNDAILVLTGTVWVTGKIILSNTSIVRLSPSYGSLSGMLMAGDGGSVNGYIETVNSNQLLGSGSPGSYLMILSQRNNGTDLAIKTSNFTNSAIFYAGKGVIEVANNASLKEITAYKLRIVNNATVTYESGLANTNFTTGPTGGWEIADQTWQLLQ